MNKYFERMATLAQSENLPPRNKFLLMNVIELRDNQVNLKSHWFTRVCVYNVCMYVGMYNYMYVPMYAYPTVLFSGFLVSLK